MDNADYEFTEELLSGYLDGELDAEQRQAVEERLANDPAARQLLSEWRALGSALRELPHHALPEDFPQRVLQQAQSTARTPAEARHRRYAVFAVLAALAATLLIMIVINAVGTPRRLPVERARRPEQPAVQPLASDHVDSIVRVQLPERLTENREDQALLFEQLLEEQQITLAELPAGLPARLRYEVNAWGTSRPSPRSVPETTVRSAVPDPRSPALYLLEGPRPQVEALLDFVGGKTVAVAAPQDGARGAPPPPVPQRTRAVRLVAMPVSQRIIEGWTSRMASPASSPQLAGGPSAGPAPAAAPAIAAPQASGPPPTAPNEPTPAGTRAEEIVRVLCVLPHAGETVPAKVQPGGGK
jgi:anti-sigma-K factor RskA